MDSRLNWKEDAVVPEHQCFQKSFMLLTMHLLDWVFSDALPVSQGHAFASKPLDYTTI